MKYVSFRYPQVKMFNHKVICKYKKKNMQVLSTNYLLWRVDPSLGSNLIGIFRQQVWEITDI